MRKQFSDAEIKQLVDNEVVRILNDLFKISLTDGYIKIDNKIWTTESIKMNPATIISSKDATDLYLSRDHIVGIIDGGNE